MLGVGGTALTDLRRELLGRDQLPASVGLAGRQAQPDKRGQTPGELAPILERLQLSAETWVDTVLNFGRWFKRAAGRAESLTAEAARRGRHWLHGLVTRTWLRSLNDRPTEWSA